MLHYWGMMPQFMRHGKRCRAIREFVAWYCSEVWLSFNEAEFTCEIREASTCRERMPPLHF